MSARSATRKPLNRIPDAQIGVTYDQHIHNTDRRDRQRRLGYPDRGCVVSDKGELVRMRMAAELAQSLFEVSQAQGKKKDTRIAELEKNLAFVTNCLEWGASPSGKRTAIENAREALKGKTDE